ncbi:MAG: Type 1 glutamine amidotransferase-like domain-containing protein [Opitutaceae bacterium]
MAIDGALHRRAFLAGAAAAAAGRGLGAAAPWAVGAPSILVSGGAMMRGNRFADSVDEVMREHFGAVRRLALVLHATHPSERDLMEARLQAAFRVLGLRTVQSLHRFAAPDALALLREADGIFLGGGETFVLLGELQRTGQLALIRERALAGVPCGGSSAGANVIGRRIGTTNDFPTAEIASREALGLLPVTINPHHPSPAKDAEFRLRAAKLRGYLQFNPGERILALGDAAVVRSHAGSAWLAAGQGWLYEAGCERALVTGDPVPELVAGSGAARR